MRPTESAESQLIDTAREISNLLDKASRARQNKVNLLSEAARVANHFNAYAEIRGESVRINDASLEGVQAEIAAFEAAALKRRQEQEAQRERDNAEAIEAWINGSSFRPWTATPRLRIGKSRGSYATGGLLPDAGSEGRDCIETSFGAEIPLDDAKRLWPLIQRQRSEGLTHEFGNRYMLGGYRLTTIRSDGSIVVGCHDIAYSEIERIAKQLGLLEEVAA